ncbi:hypothetical protein IHV25_02490 [Phaeovibrio sulfidiphilus]|uniref:Uncharacterized protein n=1 Tax=Phaeovibrio sulfidiphilus TaxID=1220600 RepID=A0A8J6YKW9_9PROT|nr:hypothetical protein [Phaeovibrio sulfidiphilus]MBE1236520.1 hypothetical protein [Phaeovibrio sulfidiphilus]
MPFHALMKAFFTIALYLACALILFEESLTFGVSDRMRAFSPSPVYLSVGVPALVCGVLTAFASPRHTEFSFVVHSALLGAGSYVAFLLAFVGLRGAGMLALTHGDSAGGLITTSLGQTVNSVAFGITFGLAAALPALLIRPRRADIGDGELFFFAGRLATVLVTAAATAIVGLMVGGRLIPHLKVF